MKNKNAEGGTRTRTALRPLDPEPSASANSATSAKMRTACFIIAGVTRYAQRRTPQRLLDCIDSRINKLSSPSSFIGDPGSKVKPNHSGFPLTDCGQ